MEIVVSSVPPSSPPRERDVTAAKATRSSRGNVNHASADGEEDAHEHAVDGIGEYDQSLRSALSELLQTSGVELQPADAGLLVDALLSPRKSVVRQNASGGGDGGSEIENDSTPTEEEIDSADATLLAEHRIDPASADDDESEDLPLGAGPVSAQRSMSYPVTVVSPRRRANTMAELRAAGSDHHLTRSLRARLGDDLSEHLDSKWLSRYGRI